LQVSGGRPDEIPCADHWRKTLLHSNKAVLLFIEICADAIAKPEWVYLEATALKSTRPTGSGDPARRPDRMR
jgi:hypothetical protein